MRTLILAVFFLALLFWLALYGVFIIHFAR